MTKIVEKKGFWISLIVFDVFMWVSAFIVDFRDFFEVPFYLIPFTPICPLFPLLLAICFLWGFKSGRLPVWLSNFTAVGIVSYGIMALIFYPLYMRENQFGWYEFGNIFWVLLYSSQIVFLRPLPRVSRSGFFIIAVYFFTKDFLDRFGGTFSYIRENALSMELADLLLWIMLAIHAAVMTSIALRRPLRAWRRRSDLNR